MNSLGNLQKTKKGKRQKKLIQSDSILIKIPAYLLGCPESSCNSYTVKLWINNYRIY